MESAKSWTPSQPCGMQMWQASAWQTNAMQEVATFLPPQRKFAKFTEYIAAGDSQAAVPFPTKSEGISTFSERQLQVFPICCYSLP